MTSRLFAALLASAALLPAAAVAQGTMDSRWLPWLGCWQAGGDAPAPEEVLVCVRPASEASGVEIATLVNGEVASGRRLIADGQQHELTDDDCSGWQSASFSADGRRVFLRSELTCEGGGKRTASGIMAIASPSVWVDAQAIGLDGERMVRASRYVRALEVPEEFALPAERAARARDARMLAAANPSLDDVREAVAQVDPEAVVAFLIERDPVFELDAARLAELADAGVPAAVIDVVVAVSYPGTFAIDREAMRTALRPRQESGETRRGRRGYGDPFGWGWGGRGRYGCYGGYGGLWYGSFYCSPYSYGAYGWGYGGWYDPYWYGYSRPVIIIRDTPSGQQGRAVRGRGYTRGGQPPGSNGGRYAEPRGGSSASSPSMRSGGGSSSAGSGSASPGGYRGGGSSGSSSGTARPRGGRN